MTRLWNWLKAKRQKRKAAEIIYEALGREAQRYPEFAEKFKKALDQIVTDEKERRVLKKEGRLPE